MKEKQKSVVVLGHSFITRLDQYIKTPGSGFKLDIFIINLIGVPRFIPRENYNALVDGISELTNPHSLNEHYCYHV